jgi:outer membrane protein assembly factor BamB
LTLRKGPDGFKVKQEYFKRNLGNKHGGVLIVGNYAYGDFEDRGQPWCAEWKTGKLRWQRPATGKGRRGGEGSASLTYADGHLYVHYANGRVALVDAGAAGYREKGSFKIPNSDRNSWAHPVVLDGKLYLREKGVLWCYDVKAK